MASVCTYTSYTPSTCHQTLIRIKEFLEGKGWHTNLFVDNAEGKAWASDGGGGYDFVTGGDSESFLEIISEGYDYVYGVTPGNQQTMMYRFRVTANGNDPLAEYLYISMIDPNNLSINYAIPTLPSDQNSFYRSYMGIPSGSGLTLHAFDLTTGSPTFDMFVLQLTDYVVQMFAIGTPDLFVDTDEFWCFHAVNSALAYYNLTAITLRTGPPICKWNGLRSANSGLFQPNFYCNGVSGVQASMTFICPYAGAVQKNDYMGKRSFIKPIWFTQDAGDQVFPAGSYPWYFCKWAGLDMAETITYGSQQYVVFPDGITNKDFGIAFRIA